jgi:membrane protease YdiL (CAAX protease family)
MEKSASNSRKAITIYLLITIALSAVVYLLTIHAGSGTGRIGGRVYGYGIMWCPALAAYLTCKISGRNISGLAWQWGKPKYLWYCYLIPMAYALVAYLIIWFTGWGGFYNKTFVTQAAHELGWGNLPAGVFIVLFFIVEGVIGLAGSMSTALGEEIGWRGFLVPELSNITSYTKTSLISGAIWAVWHYPILIFGGYNNGTSAWYGLTCFTVMVISISFVFTWFRLKSNSLWTGVMLHASHNLFIQAFFTPITTDTGHTKYFIDEFGAVLPVVTLILAIYFWTRRKEVEKPVHAQAFS